MAKCAHGEFLRLAEIGYAAEQVADTLHLTLTKQDGEWHVASGDQLKRVKDFTAQRDAAFVAQGGERAAYHHFDGAWRRYSSPVAPVENIAPLADFPLYALSIPDRSASDAGQKIMDLVDGDAARYDFGAILAEALEWDGSTWQRAKHLNADALGQIINKHDRAAQRAAVREALASTLREALTKSAETKVGDVTVTIPAPALDDEPLDAIKHPNMWDNTGRILIPGLTPTDPPLRAVYSEHLNTWVDLADLVMAAQQQYDGQKQEQAEQDEARLTQLASHRRAMQDAADRAHKALMDAVVASPLSYARIQEATKLPASTIARARTRR